MRWQIGFNKANFNIKCPECNAYFHGLLDPDNFQKTHNSLVNCEEIEECKPDYICEVSTEFYCKKIFKSTNNNIFDISPFMRTVSSNNDYLEKSTKYFAFSKDLEKYKNELSTISNLFENKSYKYLKEKLNNVDNPFICLCKKAILNYKLNNELDYLMAIHQYSCIW